MADHNKHIDDIFRDKLGDYTETPDASVWANIESGLDSDGNAGISDGGSVPKGGSGISTGKILLLLVAGAALFFTARWAIGNFNKNKTEKAGQSIIITKEESLPPSTMNVVEPAIVNENPDESATPSSNNSESENENPITIEPINPNSKERKHHKPKTISANSETEAETVTPIVRKTRKRNERPAPVTQTVAPGTNIPSVTAAASFSPAVKPAISGPENLKTSEPVQKPMLPPADTKPRIKEEMAALFFNGTINKFSTGDTPDADYGMLDTDGSLQRILNNIRKRLAAARLEVGLKGGVETGFSKYSAVKLAISPYLSYSLGSKLSLLFQPGFKFGGLTRTELMPAESYYSITNASVTANHLIAPSTDTTQPDAITRRYFYSQTYDSLTIGYKTATKSIFEFEIPVLLQYNITDRLSAYGGINFNFGKTIRIKEDRQQYNGLTLTDTVTYAQTSITNSAPVPPSIDSMFSHSAKPYESYGNQLWQNPTNDPMRVGYMLGFSYQVKERIRIDLMMQQNLSNTSYIINKDIRSIHKQPYFRVTIGYRLFKSDTKKK